MDINGVKLQLKNWQIGPVILTLVLYRENFKAKKALLRQTRSQYNF